MKNDPEIHLDDLAERFASGKDLGGGRTRKPPEAGAGADRKTAIRVAAFIGLLLVLFVLGLIVLFVRR